MLIKGCKSQVNSSTSARKVEAIEHWFSTCGSCPFWVSNDPFTEVTYQLSYIFTLQFITVVKLQLCSRNKNNMFEGHHSMGNCLRELQHYKGLRTTTIEEWRKRNWWVFTVFFCTAWEWVARWPAPPSWVVHLLWSWKATLTTLWPSLLCMYPGVCRWDEGKAVPWSSMGLVRVGSIVRLLGLDPHLSTRSANMLLLNSQYPRVLISKTEMVKCTSSQNCEDYLKLYIITAQYTGTMNNHKQCVLKYYT